MSKEEFTQMYYPLAVVAGEKYRMDPGIILSQAAIESNWGSSYGAQTRKNFFGITASGTPNEYWDGSYSVSQNIYKIKFRIYKTAQDSFFDFARLISERYPDSHRLSNDSTAYARSIAYSPYISEVNGDDRVNYMNAIISNYRSIAEIIKKKGLS